MKNNEQTVGACLRGTTQRISSIILAAEFWWNMHRQDIKNLNICLINRIVGSDLYGDPSQVSWPQVPVFPKFGAIKRNLRRWLKTPLDAPL
jgi:hypothetical protein